MFLFDWFRSFLPIHNPLGFGASDFIELVVTALLLLLVLARQRVETWAARLAERPLWAMLMVGALPVVLRLALLPQSPVPAPSGADDFSHLLVADTLRHFRLANAAHPMHRFFESVFTLQVPTYSSIYPIGQGLALALGWMIFGHPWAGVMLSVAAFGALCYWMLRSWTTPGWALAGGMLAVAEFGPLRYWMNTYWGGALAAAAGCLIFGALPRLSRSGSTRDALLLGAGLGLHLLARPFETVLVGVCALAYLLPDARRMLRPLTIAGVALLPAAGLMLLQNRQVTGNWTTLPYALSQYQYGVPATFTLQPNAAPHRELTQEQQLDYEAQVAVHGPGADTPAAWLDRLTERVRFYRFFFFAPLYLALAAFLLALRERRFLWVAATLGVLALGTNFYPYFYPHYIAAATCLFVLASVIGLSRMNARLARLILILCAAHFLFWYGFHLFGNSPIAKAVTEYDTWDFVNHGDPEGRIAIDTVLAQAAGRQLVFVRYWPRHRFDAWIKNAADIDGAPVVWALDLGAAENEKLQAYYPDRKSWLLEPDARPPRLTPYSRINRR